MPFRSLSFLAAVFISGFLLAATLHFRQWERRVIEWDVTSYYQFLPALFYHGDLRFEFVQPEDGPAHRFHLGQDEVGNRFGKMTAGLAVMYLPSFGLGHVLAGALGQPTNGFTDPYEFGLLLGAWFYVFLGLLLLRKVLLHWKFREVTVALVLLLTALGSNLPYYTSIEGGMSHAYNFFLFAALLRVYQRWRTGGQMGWALLTGGLVGLMTWIRPINVLMGLFPLIHLMLEPTGIPRGRMIRHLLGSSAAAALVVLPQLLLWKHQTGHWVMYSYGDEGFFWSDPKILQALFSYRKGWLMYTPIGGAMLLGLLPLYRYNRTLFWASLGFLVPFFYVTFSWWCWWYGGGFSARTLIDALPVLAIPLAALWEWCLGKRVLRLLAPPVLLVLMFFGLFKNWQYYHKFIHWDGMNATTYKETLFKTYHPDGWWSRLTSPDYEAAKRGER